MCGTFTGNDGRQWSVAFTLGDVREIKRDLGADLLDMGETNGFCELVKDANALGDAIAFLLRYQIERFQVSDRKLTKSLRGKATEIVTAMESAYRLFLPSPQDVEAEETEDAESRSKETSDDWWQAVHECESVVGFRCDHLTVRELFSVATSAREQQRWHVATLCSWMINSQGRYARSLVTPDSLMGTDSRTDNRQVATGEWMLRAFGVSKN